MWASVLSTQRLSCGSSLFRPAATGPPPRRCPAGRPGPVAATPDMARGCRALAGQGSGLRLRRAGSGSWRSSHARTRSFVTPSPRRLSMARSWSIDQTPRAAFQRRASVHRSGSLILYTRQSPRSTRPRYDATQCRISRPSAQQLRGDVGHQPPSHRDLEHAAVEARKVSERPGHEGGQREISQELEGAIDASLELGLDPWRLEARRAASAADDGESSAREGHGGSPTRGLAGSVRSQACRVSAARRAWALGVGDPLRRVSSRSTRGQTLGTLAA